MPKWWGPFLSASKLLSFLLYDLPLFTFPTLFSDIQRSEGPDFVIDLHIGCVPSILLLLIIKKWLKLKHPIIYTFLLKVEWYKDGVRVTMPHDNIKLLDSSQTLSVGVVVQGMDTGDYR